LSVSTIVKWEAKAKEDATINSEHAEVFRKILRDRSTDTELLRQLGASRIVVDPTLTQVTMKPGTLDTANQRALLNVGSTPEAEHRATHETLKYLKEVFAKVPFGESVVALWYFMTESPASIAEKAFAIGALVYFVSPVDALPDTIPFVGFLDDAGVIAAVVGYYGSKIDPYRDRFQDWRQRERL
jgi:uncharacterized membrane protein YkvA (DUF1232 family)